MVNLPTYSAVSARYRYSIAIDGSIFILKYAWNSREQAWYLSILDSTENPILQGIKLVPYIQLLKQYKYRAALPAGDFVVLDNENNIKTAHIDFDNLGDRFLLAYFTPEEVEAVYGV